MQGFTRDRGIVVHFDDTSLREFVFIDPPWLCALLRAAISGNSTQSTTQFSIHQHSIVDKQSLYSSLKFALRHFGQMTTHLTAGRQNSSGVALVKFRLFRACLLNLLAKFELALPCLNKMVLLASLLPDEYLLRADYPGARVKIHSKVDKWQIRAGPDFHTQTLYIDASVGTTFNTTPSTTNNMVSPIRQYLTHKRLARTLALLNPSEGRNSIDEQPSRNSEVDLAAGSTTSLLQDTRTRRKSSVVTPCITNLLSVPSPPASPKIHVENIKENILRRLYVMQYIPPGFWPRLTTRLLDDDKLGSTFSKLFIVTSCSPATSDHQQIHQQPGSESFSSQHQPIAQLLSCLNQAINSCKPGGVEEADYEKETSFIISGAATKRTSPTCCERGGFHWLLWQTGVEIRSFDTNLFSLKQFLPLANVLDVNYSMVEMEKRCEDGVWRSLPLDSNIFLLELLIPAGCRIKVEWNGLIYSLEIDRAVATKFLSIVVNIIDDLLEDWFPALGTRFVHSSEGRLLVDRLIPCYYCAQHSMEMMDNANAKGRNSEKTPNKNSEVAITEENPAVDQNPPNNTIYLFSFEECILEAKNSSAMFSSSKTWPPEAKFVPEKRDQDSDNSELICPRHSHIALHLMAPDVVFADLSSTDLVVQPANIRRGKLVGRGAFGFVFNGFVKQKNEIFTEVALKILEPVDAGSTSISSNVGHGSAKAAFEAFSLKWNNDALGGQLENCARSYCTFRQELNMLADIRHSHVTSLIGFSVQPMTLVVEWAPQGALDVMLAKYRRCNTKLHLNALQQTCVQIAKALEYLHVTNHIIYRDLKSENVLVWRFPPPYSSSPSMDVHLKLGDYGISRYSYPSGICKGYGGTEGFMAPEVMRYNGEEEYTEKVDCFSFGMFLYELITLKQPYEGHEQMKEFLLEGRRPYVSEKELLLPSNLLDLMVICWSENAEFRPSSSQLVGICSAPEFTHLLDVAVLRDNEICNSPNLALIVNCCSKEQDDLNELEQSSQSLWIAQSSKNYITSLSCSQFGWTDKKVIELTITATASPQSSAITTMCQMEQNVIWIGHADGKISICNCSSLTELSTFHASDLRPHAQTTTKQRENSISTEPPKSSAIQHILSFEERQMVVIALKHCLLICRDLVYNGCELNQVPQLLTRIEMKNSEEIFYVALLPSLTDWQIWTAHNEEKIFIHHISCNTDKLIFSTSINHSTSYNVAPKTAYTGPRGEQLDRDCSTNLSRKNVKLLIASRTISNTVWSVLENDSRLFMWRHSSLRKTLDCCKILPTSESLSSMNIEVARNSHVTCLSLIHFSICTNSSSNGFHPSQEQLLVGTNRGVVIIVQALEMLPLASFRPFNAEIEHILVCHPSTSKNKGAFTDIIHSNLRPSSTSANLIQPDSPQSTAETDHKKPQNDQGSFASRRLSRFRGTKSRTNSTDLDTGQLESLSARGGEIYEAMSKGVKEMLVGSGLPASCSAYGIASVSGSGVAEARAEEPGYFVTIGREYRCLLNRFTNISESPESTSTERCAIFWRSDDVSGWTSK
uniref:Protein kinase domain-containing protein n=1 Tax=Ditylenchus dipsaci TaxID=166011 RepID=A0A915CTS6_9BILA